MLQQAIVLSVLLSFCSAEFLGLLSGGLVSAGYLAFYLEEPYRLASTLLLAVAVFGLYKLAGRFVILYGRRRFMFTVIAGILLGWLFERLAYTLSFIPQDTRIIGYIIPGLMANDMVKQGIVKTVLAVLVCALIVRFLMTIGMYL